MSSTAADGAWEPIAAPARPASAAAPADASNTTNYSYNWAGYQVKGSFKGVSGQWHVEHANATEPGTSQEDTWVGVGGGFGDTIGSLIQAGTDMQTNKGYRNWFEIVGSGTAACGGNNGPSYSSCGGVSFVSPNALAAGDAIYAVVYWNSTTQACFTLTDSSRAAGGLNGCVSNVGVPYDTQTVEWIDEGHVYFPPSTTVYHFLMNFGQTNWTEADAFNPSTGVYTHFTNYGFTADVMSDPGTQPSAACNNSQIMAYPLGASSGSSETKWCDYD